MLNPNAIADKSSGACRAPSRASTPPAAPSSSPRERGGPRGLSGDRHGRPHGPENRRPRHSATRWPRSSA
jgi:hypothetical protein